MGRRAWSWGLCLALLVACDCDGGSRGDTAAARTSEQPRESLPAEPEGNPSGEPEAVELTTADGVRIAGTLRRGGEPGAPAVVLVHRLSGDRAEVAPVVEALSAAPGMTTLAIDMRGHGESTRGPEGETLAWSAFETADWEAVSQDVRAAVDFLAEHPDLEPGAIGLVGSSIGSSAAIRAAAEDERIDAVVAISPGRAYRGLDAITPVDSYGDRVALLAIAAEEELPAAEAARDISRIADRGTLQLYPGDVHGVALGETAPQMVDRIRLFLAETLGG